MNSRLLSIAILLLSFLRGFAQEAPLTLEHEFDGYYFPFNFPAYTESDDDRYFYPAIIAVDENRLRIKSYNEDYTVREDVNVTFPVPAGYKPTNITYSPGLALPDGTSFFVVTFNKTDASSIYHDNEYCTAAVFATDTGEKLLDLGSSNFSINFSSYVYAINGKPSVLVYLYKYDTATNSTSYTTRVYSLTGKSSAIMSPELNGKSVPMPVMVFDLNGRPVTAPEPGNIYVTRISDGSAVKTYNQH